MVLNELLSYARNKGCSDVHISEDRNPILRLDGRLIPCEKEFSMSERKKLIEDLMNDERAELLSQLKDADFSYTTDEGTRHRVNIFRRQDKLCAAIRIINDNVPSMDELKLPEVFKNLAILPRGLILVTGPTGSGKSTTLASIIDYINTNRSCHILTVEDPIEYVYETKKALINQREVGHDVDSFSGALRSSLREDPDVILVGEMRDFETISAAITAAETGHLVLSTLHTVGAASTIDRIIDVFPSHSQQQIRTQLAGVLKAVITQQLLPRASGQGRVPAFEIMMCTDAVLSMIRENKCFQLEGVIQTGSSQGMVTMDDSLRRLMAQGEIDLMTATSKAVNKTHFMK